MRKFRLIALILIASGGFSFTSAHANNNPPAPPAAAGSCDFTALKTSLNETESSGRGCDFSGQGQSRYGPAIGRYQFIRDTWNRMIQNCPGADQCPHGPAIYQNPACCAVQECAMDNLLAANYQHARNNANCNAIIGRVISSPRYGSCTVSWSGVLAAYHLGGNDACDGPANGRYGDSDGATTEADYICRHSGHPVPDQCTPPPVGEGTGVVIGTLPQLEIQGAQGDPPLGPAPADPLKEWWVAALQLMAEQFTANMVAQVQAIGMMLDAKHQLETQRILQERMARAHKDYQPSEQMCTFGTFAKDLATTQREADLTKLAVNEEILQRETGEGASKGITAVSDSLSRISKFRSTFCNPLDSGGGLAFLCPEPPPAAQQNRDINYTVTLDQPLSLEIDMTDGETSLDEESVFALVDNLFMHDVPQRPSTTEMELEKFQYHYFNYRSIIAMRGIVRNSFSNIIAMKTQTPYEIGHPGSGPYMKALMREFGLSDLEIEEMLGEQPSYYAQMEMLTKKIYQNSEFYTALYDKPTNVKRIRAAMRAIKLMQDRDIQLALQRREMLLSLMLELRLREQADSVYNAVNRAIYDENL